MRQFSTAGTLIQIAGPSRQSSEAGSNPRPAVLIAEPQLKGPAHTTVNAALIEAARLAFPGTQPTFLGPKKHLRWVERALETTPGRSAEGVDWRSLPDVPSLAKVGRHSHLIAELGVWRRILGESRRLAPEALLICSVTRTGILLLKLLGFLLPRSTPIFIVVHQLNELFGESVGSPRAKQLATLLTLPDRSDLRFLAPAEPVYQALCASFPRIAARFSWIDLPYFWQEDAPAPLPASPQELVFGFFGVGRPGRIEPFCRLAGEIRRQHPRARFVLVGHLDRQRPDLDAWQTVVEGLSPEPLPLEELCRRARQVHYAVWTSPDEDYRMTFSASFLDALSFIKPCIFLENPFITHYQETMGDFGHCCHDLEEMTEVVTALVEVEGAVPDRYTVQCHAILAERHRWAPESAAALLRRALKQEMSCRQ